MPRLTGELVEHEFTEQTVVGGSYAYAPGKVMLPKHILEQHLREKAAKEEKERAANESVGMTAEEITEQVNENSGEGEETE